MHLLIILQLSALVLGTTMAMKRGTKLQPRHSKALEGSSAMALHFTSPTRHQTIPTNAKSALRQAIMRRALPKTPRKKTAATKLKPGGKELPGKRFPKTQNPCNLIGACEKCIKAKLCSFASSRGNKLGCMDPKLEDWGHINTAKSEEHCKYFTALKMVDDEDRARYNKIARFMSTVLTDKKEHEIAMGVLDYSQTLPGGYMDQPFHYNMNVQIEKGEMKFVSRDDVSEADNGLVIYKVDYKRAPYIWSVVTHITWRSDMYNIQHVKMMCQIAAHYLKGEVGRFAIPNAYNGGPVCIEFVLKTSDQSAIGACRPIASLSSDTEVGTECT